MIATLIIWLYAGILFYLYGVSSLSLLSRWLKQPNPKQLRLPTVVLTGMILVSSLATALSLYVKLGLLAAVILLAGGFLIVILTRPQPQWTFNKPKRMEWWLVIVLLIAALVVLENATHTPSNPDTNLYHAQTIRWIETYPAVKGVGNLNGRLAFNSNWLLINAAFSFSFLHLRSFHPMAGVIFIVATLYFVEGLQGLIRRQFTFSNWFKAVFLPLAFHVLGGEISSPGTDLPVILLTWILLALVVEWSDIHKQITLPHILTAILPAFLVTLKLSSVPLLLVSGYVLLNALLQRDHRSFLAIFIPLFLIFIPWFSRSVVLSGYLVFPYPQINLFHVDWKVPAASVNEIRAGIIGWARLPNKNWSEALNMPFWIWLPNWFRNQTLNQRLVLIVSFLSPLALLLPNTRRHIFPFAVNYAAVWFWLLNAPNLRFGYGYLLGLTAFVISWSIVFIAKKLGSNMVPKLSTITVILLIVFLSYTLVSSFDRSTFQQRLFLPLDYVPSRTVPCPLDTINVYCASIANLCSYESFPCIPALPSKVQLRGDTLDKGFRSTEN